MAAAEVFASVEWAWIIEVGMILFCCRPFLHVFSKNHPPLWVADLISSIVLGVGWMTFLVLSHASQGAIELLGAFLLAYVMDDLFDQLWKRLRHN